MMRSRHASRLARPAIAVMLLFSLLLTGAWDWPTYLHDPARTANSPETGISASNAGTLTNLWWFKTGGTIASSPTIAGGIVYVGSWDGYEYALDETTGAQKWRTYLGITQASSCNPPEAGISSAATVQNGVVYVGGGDSYWYALDAATGAVLWKVFTGDNSPSGGHYNWASPVIANGSAYIGIASFGDCPLVQGQVLRVDLSTHQVAASVNLVPNGTVGGGVWTSPTVDSATNTVYVTTGTQQLTSQIYAQAMVALDGTTLAVKSFWTLPQSQAVSDSDWGNTPILFTDSANNVLVAATNKNGYVYAFNRANVGNGPIWRTQIADGGSCPQCGSGSASSGTFGNGMLFMGGGSTTVNGTTYGGSVRALDPATGAILWQHFTTSTVLPALAYANGLVIDGTGSTLEVLDATTGNLLYRYATGGVLYAAPSVADGRIFTGGTDSAVYAFGLPASVPPGTTDNLATFFNNTGISDDSDTGAANLDGYGYSYSAQALQAAGLQPGQTITYNGISFLWPNAAPGAQDNVVAQGQKVAFTTSPSGGILAFLGAASNGPSAGTATIAYTDGSTQAFQLGLSDWTLNGGGAQPSYGNSAVASMSYRNPTQSVGTYVFYTSVPLQGGKTLASVTLPATVNQGALHIFAVGVGAASAAPSATPTATSTPQPGGTEELSLPLTNAGTSNDGVANQGNFDGLGYSYSAQALQAAGIAPGATVNAGGVPFGWPNASPGSPDNAVAQGQTVALPSPAAGASLSFLGSASNGPAGGTGTLTYADGSTQSFTLTFSDWTLNGGSAAGPVSGNAVAATLPYRDTASGGRDGVATYLFTDAVALQSGKALSSITLPAPSSGTLHVFAATLTGVAAPVASSTPTQPPTATATGTPTQPPIATATGTPTASSTPSASVTPTATRTSTATATATLTPSSSNTATATPTPHRKPHK